MIESRWRDGDDLDGLMVPIPATPLIEIAGNLAYDFVILDAEHGPGDATVLHHHIATAHAVEIAALVRIHPSEFAAIPRILDLGADGIVLPDIRTAEQAVAAAALAHFAPRGTRGYASGSTAGRWGTVEPTGHAATSPLLVAMIEHPDGVAAAKQISRVAGVDGLFVGRADLAMAMSLGPEPAHPRVTEAVQAVRRADGTRYLVAPAEAHRGDIRLHNATRLIAAALRTARADARATQGGTR